MGTPDQTMTPVRQCEHCGNRAPMRECAQHSHIDSTVDQQDGRVGEVWEEGWVYRLLECVSCEEVILERWYYHEHVEDSERETLYPARRWTLRGLPPEIERAYRAAKRVERVDANAFAVLLGRVLEVTCDDQDAEGNSLHEKLEHLTDREVMPRQLSYIAHSLRKLRNIGAHPSLGELTEAEVPILDELTGAILEYVYHAPFLAFQVWDHFEALTGETAEESGEGPAEAADGDAGGPN